jgi:hypothetical protein
MVTSKPTGWVGWVYFASVMVFIVGSIQLLAGFVALFKEDFYVTTNQALIAFDYSEWGWIHILLGLASMAISWAIATGKLWGRLIGVGLVTLNLLSNAAFLPAYPIWSIMVITVDVLVIYALTMHGTEAKT